jgi:hypothetical protein
VEAVWIAVSAVAGVLAMGISYSAYRERHTDRISQREAERIRQIVRADMEPVAGRQQELALRLDSLITRQDQLAADAREQNARIGAILDRLAVMETKIEVFWRSVAMDAARIIHSPDPARAHIDALLDSFMTGTMTPEQERELRQVLVKIRDHEPGDVAVGFPVYPGEQIAAAILLRTMEYAMAGG